MLPNPFLLSYASNYATCRIKSTSSPDLEEKHELYFSSLLHGRSHFTNANLLIVYAAI